MKDVWIGERPVGVVIPLVILLIHIYPSVHVLNVRRGWAGGEANFAQNREQAKTKTRQTSVGLEVVARAF